MEQLLNELIKYYLNESSHNLIDIPKEYVNRREFLRGLLNKRKVEEVPKEIIDKENELLQLELKEKKLVNINDFNDRLSIWQGDITNVICDAIINPTDSKMIGCTKPNHNCVSNKINTYAGVCLRLKCKEITRGQEINECKVILTDGFNLPCKYIIHTVRPTISDKLDEEDINKIRDFYYNSLDIATKNNIKTICIPNLSIDNNKDKFAKICINIIKDYLKNNNTIEKILFNIYTLEDYDLYSKYIKKKY